MRTCQVSGCDKPAKGRGYICSMHVARFVRHGSYDTTNTPTAGLDKEKTFHHHNPPCEKPVDGSCWVWNGYFTNGGYGCFQKKIDGVKVPFRAHRVSYEIYNGEIPDGMFVCHTCDNPACVNPEHLFLGTPKDNHADMVEKGRARYAVGEHASKTKLRLSDVVEILWLLWAGVHKKTISKIYGVSETPIYLIDSGKSWAWFTGKGE